ncbi:hypothetical protein [Paucibacter sp. Y2R2-4]|uniref:hypothetical protein n=1 Tax=Paucibacter sp. Y2R2-4 TaxID=2893553 RepID=UPI0021E36B52|nr:hypothetical protein [Paucibacter sp. Y2R2-4]MCV2349000.1 hypothetical protein [Paucibacter sp. Y2R2-4]
MRLLRPIHFSGLSLISGLLGLVVSTAALAKLPAPSDEAKAKAAVTAAKTAWTDKVSAYQLCQAMNRTAEGYRKSAKAAGKELQPVVETPACTDPGPFVPPEPAASAVAGGTVAPAATSPSAAKVATASAPPASPAQQPKK